MKVITMFANVFSLIGKGIASAFSALMSTENNNDREVSEEMKVNLYNGVADLTVTFSEEVLDDFRKNVGCFKAETGGMLASTTDSDTIDKCYFDVHSKNTSGSFYYDVESMSEVFRTWKDKGYTTNGIYHSHPYGVIRPSYHDISSALLHIDFFGLDYFYLPIFQPERRGFYTMYFYVVKKVENNIEVNLNYVVEADKNGYNYIPFRAWHNEYPVEQLNSYRKSFDDEECKKKNREKIKEQLSGKTCTSVVSESVEEHKPEIAEETVSADNGTAVNAAVNADEYFKKVSSLYPDKVLDKVITCIGVGGARSFIENCARSGFRNYILMDADTVSPSNVATQGVFISEMGKKKVEVLRDRILDINPDANVVCVDKFLDDNMSDAEFKSYMDRFPGKQPSDYLILGCTDNFEAQKRSSLLALKYGSPYLAAMMYEGGAAAELIFVYPGVTESCPRCLLRDRFEKYENGFKNDVDSSACPIFATERMNALKGYIALMLLMYGEDDGNPLSTLLDGVKDRNFVEIRLTPFLKDSKLGIGLFDRVFEGASRYVYFDETIWVPQHPDSEKYGVENCKLCGGTGDLTHLSDKWKDTDTRYIKFTEEHSEEDVSAVAV